MFRVLSGLAKWLPMPVKRSLYNLGPLSHWIRNALNKMVPAGLTQVEVLGGELRGEKMLLDLHTQKDSWFGTIEPESQRAIRDWVNSGMVVYDLGANIGFFSVLLARCVGKNGRVFAFEPLPANHAQLAANLDLHSQASPFELVPRAVAERSGAVTFQTQESGAVGRLEGAPPSHDFVTTPIGIQAVSLDDFVYKEQHPAPDFIKMDIEGAEGLALKGMSRLLEQASPLLLIELHNTEASTQVERQFYATSYTLHLAERGYPVAPELATLPRLSHILARPAHD